MALSPPTGSTAPTITSPLLAWPSRPVERDRSPMSSPSSTYDSPPRTIPAAVQSTPSLALQSAVEEPAPVEGKKTKGYTYVQIPTVPKIMTNGQSPVDRRYTPPTKPLSPAKLARIAQSFGIVIPASPAQSPGASSVDSTSKLAPTPTRGSPHLLTVIPPTCLLPPKASTDDSDVARRKRWKRGRLLPLQSTMGGMLLSIAREYGLPSTQGIELYLVPPSTSLSSSSSTASEECSGPLISSATWSTLFNTPSLSQSQNGSPKSPLRASNSSSATHGYPPSPVSLQEKHGMAARRSSFGNASERIIRPFVGSATPSAQSDVPLTPRSTQAHTALSNLIVGTVEFDVNPDVALWLEGWRRSSAHRRKRTVSDNSGIALSEGGMRQLRLVSKVNNPTLRSFEVTPSTPVTPAEEGLAGAPELALVRTSESDDYRGLPYLVSPPRTLEDRGSRFGLNPADASRLSELLASPIALDKAHGARIIEGVNRGSAIVMSEQLDALERMMSELSPREIRLTSPRSMTPRMASKIAAAQAQLAQAQAGDTLAVPGTRALPTSPLATSHQDQAPEPVPEPLKSAPTLKPLGIPVSSPEMNPETPKMSSEEFNKPSWPSLPYGSPESPRLDDMFPRNKFVPLASAAALSAESQQRAEDQSKTTAVTPNSTSAREAGWRPQRPPRPRSPGLEHHRSLSHTLSPELVDHLRSPPGVSPEKDVRRSVKQRSRASGSIKAIRTQMSAKNLNLKWSEGNKDKEKVGDREKETAVIGLANAAELPTVGEFGQENRPSLSPTESTATHTYSASSLDSKSSLTNGGSNSASGKHGFAQRFLSFGRRQAQAAREGIPAPVMTQRSVSAPKPTISSPISSSLQHEGSGHPVVTSPTIPGSTVPLSSHVESPPRKSESSSITSPASPSSAYSVKRKPVPSQGLQDMPRGESLQSMRSFVLEDGPKDRPLFNAL